MYLSKQQSGWPGRESLVHVDLVQSDEVDVADPDNDLMRFIAPAAARA